VMLCAANHVLMHLAQVGCLAACLHRPKSAAILVFGSSLQLKSATMLVFGSSLQLKSATMLVFGSSLQLKPATILVFGSSLQLNRPKFGHCEAEGEGTQGCA